MSTINHDFDMAIEDDDGQIIEPVGYDFGVTRRTFVQILGAGLVIVVAAPTFGQQQRGGSGRGGRGGGGGGREQRPVPIDARIHIAPDGTISVMTGKVEGGQGARAQISQAAAEELRVPLDSVKLQMADTQITPDDGGTSGSRTTPATLPAVRKACAAARAMLEKASKESGKQLTYADLAGDAYRDMLKQLVPADVTVTPTTEWKTMGQPAARPNGRDIVTGKHQYPSDIIRPGMLYGKVLRPATYGARLSDIDLAPAKAMDGVIAVRDGSFVAVAAPNTATAKKATQAVEATAKWDSRPQPASKDLYKYLREHARGIPANPYKDDGKPIRATYTAAYIQHAPMEPRAAVAEWSADGKVTVWTATQSPFRVRGEIAEAFHIDEAKVRVIVPDFGGGFGGKHTGETAVEAARLAKAAGKPVAVRWTRAEEFTWAYFRPAAVMDAEAAIGSDGKLASWYFVNINAGGSGLRTPYRVEKKREEAVNSDPPLRHGSYRALASTANNFGRECFMDELAAAASADPLEFRLAHLDDERLRAVLQEAAKRFEWTAKRAKKQDNVGVGIACGEEKGSFVAACAEVEIEPATRAIRVRKICQAFECGAIVNPPNLLSQVQGGILMALGGALREAMEFADGKIRNATFYEYKVPRFKDVPPIEVHLIDRKDLASAGAGETPLIVTAPAIANAVFHATGVRLRDMPLQLPAQIGGRPT